MNDHKKFIARKRSKIFFIQKNFNEGSPKKLSNQKKKLSSINSQIPLNEDCPTHSKNTQSNFFESVEKASIDSSKHCLTQISRLVFKHLSEIENTTGNEVTNYIKNILQPRKNDKTNQKNIQRRVYDAINVMSAAGLIKKNRQEIQFIKKDNSEKNNNIINDKNFSHTDKKERNCDIEEKIESKTKELEEWRSQLKDKYFHIKFFEKINKLNELSPQRKFQKKLDFPFDIIKFDNSSPIKITSTNDNTRFLLLSNSQIEHIDQNDIVKRMVVPDIISQLQNIPNVQIDNNIIQNKECSKKSTNDDSLLADNNIIINNIDNNEDKKSPDESNNLLKYNIQEKIETSINKEKLNALENQKINLDDNIDSEVFDYLKKLKSFKDELTLYEPKKTYNNENIVNEHKEEIDNNYEKDDENEFIENRMRNNSNMSYASSLYDEKVIKQNKNIFMTEFVY
jgi:hypothetical protein